MSIEANLGGLAFDRLEMVEGEPVSESAMLTATGATVTDIPAGQTQTVEMFDVLLAENLDPPRRHLQRYLWLETIAPDQRRAVGLAQRWAQADPRELEVTGMVRRGSLRETRLGDLAINWAVPVLRDCAAGRIVRHPLSGLRVGFVATERAEARHLPAEARGEFRLLTRKPTDDGHPVCLAPVVDMVGWT